MRDLHQVPSPREVYFSHPATGVKRNLMIRGGVAKGGETCRQNAAARPRLNLLWIQGYFNYAGMMANTAFVQEGRVPLSRSLSRPQARPVLLGSSSGKVQC